MMFRKILLSSALLAALSWQAAAQFRFSGRITAEGGQALEGASIRLSAQHTYGAVSDAGGNFTVPSLPAGTYTLTASSIGYRTFTGKINLGDNVNGYIIRLSPVNLFVKPVEITGIRAGDDAPFAKSAISKEELERVNLGQDLPVLLDRQPSVVTTSDAGAGVGYTGIRIRGTDVTRINVTLNGIPVNDAESQGTFFVDLPDIASSVNSIQIQRGVGTSTNGAGAFGATVSISTNEFNSEAYADLYSSYGSFNTWKNTVKAGSGLLNDHFTVDLRLSKVSSDGYIDRASSDLRSLYFSTAYLNKNTSLRFNLITGKEKTYQAWNGVPEDSLGSHRTYNELGLKPDGSFYSNQTDNYQQDYYQLFFNHEINQRWNFNAAAFLTRGRGYYEEYKQGEPYADYGVPDVILGGDTVASTDLVRRLWLDNYYYGGIFSVNYTGSRFSSTLGGGWNRYDGKHYGRVLWAQSGGFGKSHQWYYNEAHKADLSLYWKGKYTLAASLDAFLDLQYRSVKYDINGFDDYPGLVQHNRYRFFNPKAGLSWRLNGRDRLYASYAVAHKEPNRDDFEAGKDQVPKPETLGDLEAGYEHTALKSAWGANIFYMDYRDQLVLTGKINDVGAYTRTNIPRSYRAGLEAFGNVKLGDLFEIKGNAAYSRNKVKGFTEYIDNYDNGKQQSYHYSETDISFSPDWVGAFTFTAHPLKKLDVDLTGKYVGRQYLDNTSRSGRSIDPYFVNDLHLRYRLRVKGIRMIEASLLLNNLFNVMYNANGYTYSFIAGGEQTTVNYFFPQAGFNVLFGLHLGF